MTSTIRTSTTAAVGSLYVLLGMGMGVPAAERWSRDPEPLVPVPGSPVYAFEHDVPVNFRPDPHSHLSLNHRWYRGAGDTSLRWDWERGGSGFEIRSAGNFPGESDRIPSGWGTGVPRLVCERIPVLSTWVFSESPLEGMLDIAVLAGENLQAQFFVSLAFTGWKELRIPYAVGLPASAETLRIRAPEGTRTGTLYFDLLAPWCEVLRWRELPRQGILWPTASSPEYLNR